jgi:hypothetical protein
MSQFLVYSVVFIGGEVLATTLFRLMIYLFFQGMEYEQQNTHTPHISKWRSIAKGVIERLFIYISILQNFPQSLFIFGAIKVGTRLESDKSKRVSTDLFIIGNFLSVLAVLGYLAVGEWLNNF